MTDKNEQTKSAHPWRDNIEAVTMAIIVAVLLKYFVVEAYKIPTGSMQPTLMGNADTGIFDRILVDKLSYHFRDPERWEVAVFKYPLDRSKNFIKRVCGMPGEELKILHGDLFVRESPTEEWRALRRPPPVQRETLKRLDSTDAWKPEGGWTVDGTNISGPGPGSARFPRSGDSIKDRYADGYPGDMGKKLRRQARISPEKNVGDLRIEGRVAARAECEQVTIELREGARLYTFVLPGPAASDDARPSIRLDDGSERVGPREVLADEPWRLEAGEDIAFAGQNLDDLLQLELGGEVRLELEVPAAADQRSSITLGSGGGGVDFEDLRLSRDIYYTSENAKQASWTIPDDSYFMLGDNTQDSADSREWTLAVRQLGEGDDGGLLRGNQRNGDNPITVTGRAEGTEIFFRDEYGERHHFLAAESRQMAPIHSPYVRRDLITGRALLVFWPFVPSLDVYRLRWVH